MFSVQQRHASCLGNQIGVGAVMQRTDQPVSILAVIGANSHLDQFVRRQRLFGGCDDCRLETFPGDVDDRTELMAQFSQVFLLFRIE